MSQRKRILYIGNKLSKHGFTPTGIEFLGPKLEGMGFKVYFRSSIKNQFIRLLHMCYASFSLRKKYDIVLLDTYSTSAFYYALLVSIICRFLEKPYIPIVHGGNMPKRMKESKKLSDLLFKNSIDNVVLSDYMGKKMELRGYPITVIPNFIDLELYTNSKKINPYSILWVRSFHAKYNPGDAVYILSKLILRYPKVNLIMVGPDKDGTMQNCKELAFKLGVEDNVTFTGKLTKEEWIKRGSSSSIFLNTTSVDNFPVSVLEAMALSIPIVTTNAGGIPWLVKDGYNGLVSEIGAIDEMAKKIGYLFENEKTRKEISENARKTAEQYSWINIEPQWWKFLS